ncbi:MAG: ATP-binding cassette domain-containing protein, partial [Pseudomonadota bacterium]
MTLTIETQDLSKRYGSVRAVDGIDLQVPEGTVFGFLGPNGSGKTTTLRMLLGLIRPNRGTVRVNGADLDKD